MGVLDSHEVVRCGGASTGGSFESAWVSSSPSMALAYPAMPTDWGYSNVARNPSQ